MTQLDITKSLRESARIKEAIARTMVADIEKVIGVIVSAYKSGGKVVLLGNGGSAADAQHIAGEFVGKLIMERRALPAIALTTNTSILTAIANDCGYASVFTRQVEALVEARDVVIGISTSGNSANVLEAIKTARTKGARTVALTGGKRGKLAGAADIAIVVPSESTPRIQEAHITLGHIICEQVEKEIAAA